jgi:hypothetical protein
MGFIYCAVWFQKNCDSKNQSPSIYQNQTRHRAYFMRLLAASGLQAAPVLRSGGMPVSILQ